MAAIVSSPEGDLGGVSSQEGDLGGVQLSRMTHKIFIYAFDEDSSYMFYGLGSIDSQIITQTWAYLIFTSQMILCHVTMILPVITTNRPVILIQKWHGEWKIIWNSRVIQILLQIFKSLFPFPIIVGLHALGKLVWDLQQNLFIPSSHLHCYKWLASVVEAKFCAIVVLF